MRNSQPQSSISRTLAFLGLFAALVVTMVTVVSTGVFAPASDASRQKEEVEVAAGADAQVSTVAPPGRGGFYTVQSGDTLDDIARKHGTTIEVIVDLNPGINDPYNLMPGTRLAVP